MLAINTYAHVWLKVFFPKESHLHALNRKDIVESAHHFKIVGSSHVANWRKKKGVKNTRMCLKLHQNFQKSKQLTWFCKNQCVHHFSLLVVYGQAKLTWVICELTYKSSKLWNFLNKVNATVIVIYKAYPQQIENEFIQSSLSSLCQWLLIFIEERIRATTIELLETKKRKRRYKSITHYTNNSQSKTHKAYIKKDSLQCP